MTVARAIVYGTFALIVGAMATVLFCVFFVRIVTVYLPNNRVWVAEMGLGVLFSLASLVLWGKARKIPHR